MKFRFFNGNKFLFSAGGGINQSYYSSGSAVLFPRFNIINRYSDNSLSIGLPAAVGYTPDATDPFFAHLPILAEYNFGNQATKDFYKNFGVFFGLGYNTFFVYGDRFSGIAASGGFRWWLFRIPFSFNYLFTSTNDRGVLNYHSFSFTAAFGKWVRKNRQYNKVSRFSAPFRR